MVMARAASRRRRAHLCFLGPCSMYPCLLSLFVRCGRLFRALMGTLAPLFSIFRSSFSVYFLISLIHFLFPPIHHHAVLPHLAAPVPGPLGDPPRQTQQQLLPSRLAGLRPALHRRPSDDDRGGGVRQTPCPRRGRRRRVDDGESPTGRPRPTPRARRRFVRDRASDDGVGGRIKILPAGLPRSRHKGRGRRPVRDPLRPAADRVQRRHRTVRA